jgi:hypothetical protein
MVDYVLQCEPGVMNVKGGVLGAQKPPDEPPDDKPPAVPEKPSEPVPPPAEADHGDV